MVTRISGMASGMDIDSMVKGMLSADRVKVDKVAQNRQKLEWKQQLYNDLNKELANFLINARKDLGLTKTTSSGTTLNTGIKGIGWHKTATSDKPETVTATVSGVNSFSGTHKVEVKSLAKGVSANSSSAVGAIDKNGVSEGLGYSGTFKINDKTVTIKTTDTLSDIASRINSSGSGVKASYDSTLDSFFMQTNGVGSEARISLSSPETVAGNEINGPAALIAALKLEIKSPIKAETLVSSTEYNGVAGSTEYVSAVSSGSIADSIDIGHDTGLGHSGTIKINGIEITINPEHTMDNIIDSINAKKGDTKVIANYDISTGKFSFKSTETGDLAKIKLEDGTSNFVSALKLEVRHSESDKILGIDGSTYTGTKAKVYYQGLGDPKDSTVPLEYDSNTFSLNGVDFTAKSEGIANISINTDADSAIEKIKKFVEDYNSILDKASAFTKEKYNRSYQPLTAEEKEAMSDDEVKLWESRAKKGLLYRDNTIDGMLTKMRSKIYDRVENAAGLYNQIAEIGITTGSYTSGGKLQVDESKLRTALSTDADGVLSVLFKESETYGNKDDRDLTATEISTKRSESGIFTRISDEMTASIKEIINRSGIGESETIFRNLQSTILIDFRSGKNNITKQGSVSMLESDIYKLDKQMDSLNSWLFNRENAYYARFTAMEKAMQNANNQSSWLMQQMGS